MTLGLLTVWTLALTLPGTPTATDATDPVGACVAVLQQPASAAAVAGAWNDKGKLLHQAKDLAGATAAFQVAVALNPLHPEFANNLAFLYQLQGLHLLAEYWYGKTLELDGKRAVAHANYASFLQDRAIERTPGRDPDRDLALAAEHLTQSALLPDRDPTVACAQARVAALRNLCVDAATLRDACRKAPQKKLARQKALGELAGLLGDCWFAEGDFDAARKAYQDAESLQQDVAAKVAQLDAAARKSEVPATPDHQLDLQDARGRALQALERLDKADFGPETEKLLLEALRMAPDAGIAHAASGEWLAHHKRFAEAELAWSRALHLGLGDDRLTARAQAGLGRLYLRWPDTPRYAEAAALLAEAVRREPTRPDLRWDLVQAYRHSGQLRKALAQLERYLQSPMAGSPEQRRDAVALRKSLAATLGAAADPLPEEDATPKDRSPEQTAREAARSLAGQDRYADAAEVLRAYLTHAKAGPDLHNDLAQYLHGLGDVEGAMAALRGSLQANDRQPAVHLELGRWLARLGRPEQALPHLMRAEELGIAVATVERLQVETAPQGQGVRALLADLIRRQDLQDAISSLDDYLDQARQTPPAPDADVKAARELRESLVRRLRQGALVVLAAVILLMLGTLGVLWRRHGGRDLAWLIQHHPETGPEVQRILAGIRHEVLKHNTTVLTGLAEAIAAGQAQAPELAAHARTRLLGGGKDVSVAQQLAGYVRELQQLGQARGVRLNLRRRDRAISALLNGFAELRAVDGPLARVASLGPRAKARLLRHLGEAARLLNADGYEAVRNLLDSLRLLGVDRVVLQGVFDRVRQEPAFASLAIPTLAIAPSVELPVWVLVPRPAFEDILTNLLRNALQSSLAHGGGGRVGLAVETEVSPVTGLERAVFAVRDGSAEVLTTEMLRGRYIEEGIGLTADLVARYEGTLDVREETGAWTKAVVVKLPLAHPPADEAP